MSPLAQLRILETLTRYTASLTASLTIAEEALAAVRRRPITNLEYVAYTSLCDELRSTRTQLSDTWSEYQTAGSSTYGWQHDELEDQTIRLIMHATEVEGVLRGALSDR